MADSKNKVSTDAQTDGSIVGTFENKRSKMSQGFKRSYVNASGGTNSTGNFHYSRPQKIIFMLGLAAIITVASVLVLNNKPYVLKVTGNDKSFKLSQKEYDVMVEQAKQIQIPTDVAKQTIITAYQYKIVAPQLKLAPSDEQVKTAAQAGAGYSGEGPLNEFQQLYGYVSGVEGRLKLTQTGGYAAARIVYPFDKVYYDSELVSYDTTPDLATIAAAKQTALTRAKEDRQKLLNKNTTIDELISKVQNDPKYTWAGGSNSSKQLNINLRGVTLVDNDIVTHSEPDYIMSAINSLNKEPGVSEVQEIRAAVYGAPQPDVLGYFFVAITEVLTANPEIQGKLVDELFTIKVIDNAK